MAVEYHDPSGKKLVTVYIDEDGYYLFKYKHKGKSNTYTVKLPGWAKSVKVTVKDNDFAEVDFDVT